MKGCSAKSDGASDSNDCVRVIAADIAASHGSDQTAHVPLDIADPDGRFGNWMPGDDPDDWR